MANAKGDEGSPLLRITGLGVLELLDRAGPSVVLRLILDMHSPRRRHLVRRLEAIDSARLDDIIKHVAGSFAPGSVRSDDLIKLITFFKDCDQAKKRRGRNRATSVTSQAS